MDRISLIQKLINHFNYNTYLEIGTWKGESFFPIRCKNKIAVDPFFKISLKNKIKWFLRNPSNLKNKYFKMTSDNFFFNYEDYLINTGKPDIIFIDGLHTFRASLNDVLNSLKYLKKGGTIICHDCFPPSKEASISAENLEDAHNKNKNLVGWNREWCGDTWKTINYLKVQYPDQLEVNVINYDFGCGVIRKKNNDNMDLSINESVFSEVSNRTYEEMIKDPEKIIGLGDEIKWL